MSSSQIALSTFLCIHLSGIFTLCYLVDCLRRLFMLSRFLFLQVFSLVLSKNSQSRICDNSISFSCGWFRAQLGQSLQIFVSSPRNQASNITTKPSIAISCRLWLKTRCCREAWIGSRPVRVIFAPDRMIHGPENFVNLRPSLKNRSNT